MIADVASKLRKAAGLPAKPTGVVANGNGNGKGSGGGEGNGVAKKAKVAAS